MKPLVSVLYQPGHSGVTGKSKEERVHPSPALDDHHLPDQPDPIPVPTVQPISGWLIAAATVSTVVVLLVLADVAVPEARVPEPIRDLTLAVMVTAWALWYVSWVRAELRADIRARIHGVCCAEAYVAGLARKPFPASMSPDGRHLHSAG